MVGVHNYFIPIHLIHLLDDSAIVSSSPMLGPDISVTSASIIRSGHLPPPQLGIINEIERAIKALSRTQAVKERICEYIQNEVSNTRVHLQYVPLHCQIPRHFIYSIFVDITWTLLSMKRLQYRCPIISIFSVFCDISPVADYLQHGVCSIVARITSRP